MTPNRVLFKFKQIKVIQGEIHQNLKIPILVLMEQKTKNYFTFFKKSAKTIKLVYICILYCVIYYIK